MLTMQYSIKRPSCLLDKCGPRFEWVSYICMEWCKWVRCSVVRRMFCWDTVLSCDNGMQWRPDANNCGNIQQFDMHNIFWRQLQFIGCNRSSQANRLHLLSIPFALSTTNWAELFRIHR